VAIAYFTGVVDGVFVCEKTYLFAESGQNCFWQFFKWTWSAEVNERRKGVAKNIANLFDY
jgi:hypothetical protein